MPVSVQHSPPPLHQPGAETKRPKGEVVVQAARQLTGPLQTLPSTLQTSTNLSPGILKNPSFSTPSGPSSHYPQTSPIREDDLSTATTIPLDPQDSKDITLQNTLQNAGARRSSSTARRASTAARRHSSSNTYDIHDDEENMRLKWDEANLYLAEQDRGSRMKITEPKTPYEYGRDLPPEDDLDDEEDVAIDPKYVNVDEVDMAKGKKKIPRHRESEIPGLELGEPEEDYATTGVAPDDARIVRGGQESLSREGSQGSSREKHVSVSEDAERDGGTADEGQVGMPTKEEMEKHRKFEEMRKKHYEMKDIKGLLGHPEEIDAMEEDDEAPSRPSMPSLPDRGVNGTR